MSIASNSAKRTPTSSSRPNRRSLVRRQAPDFSYRLAYQEIYSIDSICSQKIEAHDWIRHGYEKLSDLSEFLDDSRCKKLIVFLPGQVVSVLSDEFVQLLHQHQIEALVLEGGEILELGPLLQGSSCLRELTINSSLPELNQQQLTQLAKAHQALLRLRLSSENQLWLETNVDRILIKSSQELKILGETEPTRRVHSDHKTGYPYPLNGADYVITNMDSRSDLLAVARSGKHISCHQLPPLYQRFPAEDHAVKLSEIKSQLQPTNISLVALQWLKHHRPRPDIQLITQLAVLMEYHPQDKIRSLAGQVYHQYFPIAFKQLKNISRLRELNIYQNQLLLPQLWEPNIEAKLFVELAWKLRPTEHLQLILDYDLLSVREKMMQHNIGYFCWSLPEQKLQAWKKVKSGFSHHSNLDCYFPSYDLSKLAQKLLKISHWPQSRFRDGPLLLDWARLRLRLFP